MVAPGPETPRESVTLEMPPGKSLPKEQPGPLGGYRG